MIPTNFAKSFIYAFASQLVKEAGEKWRSMTDEVSSIVI